MKTELHSKTGMSVLDGKKITVKLSEDYVSLGASSNYKPVQQLTVSIIRENERCEKTFTGKNIKEAFISYDKIASKIK